MRRKKKQAVAAATNVELNIMPFIDIFSLLNTFLLFTAAFVSIGLLKVQVPYLSNAEPDKAPQRSLEINVSVDSTNVDLRTRFSSPPYQARESSYATTPDGIADFHQALLALKQDNPKQDLVTLYSDDGVSYKLLVVILDAVKVDSSQEYDETKDNNTLFPKVVIGSVLL
ncbi:MAG: biopolymer transporter ExbD [Pseudomonadota bacterium]|nr:biopolymer transporter ExbD [Pseudomonadota bacterium]